MHTIKHNASTNMQKVILIAQYKAFYMCYCIRLLAPGDYIQGFEYVVILYNRTKKVVLVSVFRFVWVGVLSLCFNASLVGFLLSLFYPTILIHYILV